MNDNEYPWSPNLTHLELGACFNNSPPFPINLQYLIVGKIFHKKKLNSLPLTLCIFKLANTINPFLLSHPLILNSLLHHIGIKEVLLFIFQSYNCHPLLISIQFMLPIVLFNILFSWRLQCCLSPSHWHSHQSTTIRFGWLPQYFCNIFPSFFFNSPYRTIDEWLQILIGCLARSTRFNNY